MGGRAGRHERFRTVSTAGAVKGTISGAVQHGHISCKRAPFGRRSQKSALPPARRRRFQTAEAVALLLMDLGPPRVREAPVAAAEATAARRRRLLLLAFATGRRQALPLQLQGAQQRTQHMLVVLLGLLRVAVAPASQLLRPPQAAVAAAGAGGKRQWRLWWVRSRPLPLCYRSRRHTEAHAAGTLAQLPATRTVSARRQPR